MPVVSTLGAMSSRGFGEFAQAQPQGKYVEDYFSTYLYKGNGGSFQTVSTGIPLASTGEWKTTFLTGSSGGASGAAIDSSGNVYVTSSTEVRKIDSSGVTQWSRTLTLAAYSVNFNAVTVSSTDDIYACGQIFDSGASAQCFIVAKYDTSGTLVWQKFLSTSLAASYANAVTTDSSGNVYVGGTLTDTGGNIYGYFVKFNSSGTVQFQRTFRETSSNSANAIFVDSSGNIYVAGNVTSNTLYISKWDSSGNNLWQNKVTDTTSNGAYAKGVTVDSSGNVYVTGVTTRSAECQTITLKYNSSGTLQWQRKFYDVASTTLANSTGTGVVIDSNGVIHVAATTLRTTYVYTTWIRYNSSGSALTRVGFYASAGDCQSYGIILSGSTKVILPVNSASGTYIELPINGVVSGTATLSTVSNPGTEAAGTATNSASTASTSSAPYTFSSPMTGSSLTKTSSVATQSAATSDGGLVWIKARDASTSATGHVLIDTTRGRGSYLRTQGNDAQLTSPTWNDFISFNPNGFTVGSPNNYSLVNSSVNYATWTFRKEPKFFDIIQYTGNGGNQIINHNLGATPGMIVVKAVDAIDSWAVYHVSNGNTEVQFLNSTSARLTDNRYWNNTSPTSTTFSTGTLLNSSGKTYIAYLFANSAGVFGVNKNLPGIVCSNFTTDGAGSATISLGFEPQFLLVKSSISDDGLGWNIYDTVRGMTYSGDNILKANVANVESYSGSSTSYVAPSATGAISLGGLTPFTAYICLAVRRGPMKTPTSGTSVFNPITYTGTGAANTVVSVVNQPDSTWWASRTRSAYADNYTFDRLRGVNNSGGSGGGGGLKTNLTDAESPNSANQIFALNNTSVQFGSSAFNGFDLSGLTGIMWNFTRAPGFFDTVCYNNPSAQFPTTVNHNLGVAPELMILKNRIYGDAWSGWFVYAAPLGKDKLLYLDKTDAAVTDTTVWDNTLPTSTQFKVNNYTALCAGNVVAYLFATCPNVSKVGSYTGTGATQTISCGFTGGARYVLIKRTDSTGSWWVWDTARGMVAGSDRRLPYNSTTAEANANWVYTTTGGFQIVTSDATVNASGGTYIYLAIA